MPNALKSAAEIALNSQLQQLLDKPELDTDAVQGILREAMANKIALAIVSEIERTLPSLAAGTHVAAGA